MKLSARLRCRVRGLISVSYTHLEVYKRQVAALLEAGEVIIYPTDSVYAFGCSVHAPRAIERMRRIKGKGETTF